MDVLLQRCLSELLGNCPTLCWLICPPAICIQLSSYLVPRSGEPALPHLLPKLQLVLFFRSRQSICLIDLLEAALPFYTLSPLQSLPCITFCLGGGALQMTLRGNCDLRWHVRRTARSSWSNSAVFCPPDPGQGDHQGDGARGGRGHCCRDRQPC